MKEALELLLVICVAASLDFRVQDVTGKTVIDVKSRIRSALNLTQIGATVTLPTITSTQTLVVYHHQRPLSQRVSFETPMHDCCWALKNRVCLLPTHTRARIIAPPRAPYPAHTPRSIDRTAPHRTQTPIRSSRTTRLRTSPRAPHYRTALQSDALHRTAPKSHRGTAQCSRLHSTRSRQTTSLHRS